MTAVADTSPVCYLILIGEIGVLPQLFGEILIPQAVLKELQHHEGRIFPLVPARPGLSTMA